LYKKRLSKKKNKGPGDGISTGHHGVQKVKDKDIKKMGQSKNSRRTDSRRTDSRSDRLRLDSTKPNLDSRLFARLK